MAKVKYNIYVYKECDVDIIARRVRYCATCGDNLFLEKERTIWLERPVIYKRPWTVDEDEYLIEAVRRGHTNLEIAEELERTKDAVAERLRRLRKKKKIVRGEKK